MKTENRAEIRFTAISANEGFARVCIGAFAAQLDPTLEQLGDIKTAVSEAVTNVIVHAYPKGEGEVTMRASIDGNVLQIEIEDDGVGIENVAQAMQPFFTTGKAEERSGMGFMLMQTFMDNIAVDSQPGRGTRVRMKKLLGREEK